MQQNTTLILWYSIIQVPSGNSCTVSIWYPSEWRNILRNIYRIVTLLSCCVGCLRPSSTAQYSVVFWVLKACGDCNTSLSGNNTKQRNNIKQSKRKRYFRQTLCTFHWLILLLIHQLSLSCQNWFIRTKVVICDVHMHCSTQPRSRKSVVFNKFWGNTKHSHFSGYYYSSMHDSYISCWL